MLFTSPGPGSLWPKYRARYCPRRFFEAVEAIPFKVREHFGLPGRPQDFHPVRLTAASQSEMEPEVALRQIAASAPYLVSLRNTPGRNLYPCIQCHLIASGAGEFEADPVVTRTAFGTQNDRLTFEILHHDFQGTVVEQIADGEAAAHSRNLQRGSRQAAHIAEGAITAIQEQLARLAV